MITHPQSERREYSIPGGSLSAVHFGRTSNPLKLVFLHANGFNSLAYKSILEPLGIHALALDLRGHGMSQSLPTPERDLPSFQIFADDVAAFFNEHVKAPVVLAGHSMGAVSAILAAPDMTDKISGYVGFDPVTIPDLARLYSKTKFGRGNMRKRFVLAKKASQRRRVFDSAEAMFERYQGRGTFKGVSDAALRNYIEGGILPHADGVELACDPKWEQMIYAAQGHNIYSAAKNLPENSRLVFAGKFGPSTAGTRRKIARIVGPDCVEFHKELSHFFPLINEDFAVECFKSVLAKAAL